MISGELWEAFVGFSDDVLKLAALVAVIWSAYVFVRKIGEDREAERIAKLKNWRKAQLHKIQHNSDRYMTLTEMTEKLRSSSFSTNFEIKRHEIDDEVVRLLVMDLIADGILFQIYPDVYGLQQHRFDPGAEINSELLVNHRAAMRAIELITEYPDHYDLESLFEKLREENYSTLTMAGFKVALYDAAEKGLIATSSDLKWHPVLPSQKASN